MIGAHTTQLYTAQATFPALWVLSASVITAPQGLQERYCAVRSLPALQKPPWGAQKTSVLLGAVPSHFQVLQLMVCHEQKLEKRVKALNDKLLPTCRQFLSRIEKAEKSGG